MSLGDVNQEPCWLLSFAVVLVTAHAWIEHASLVALVSSLHHVFVAKDGALALISRAVTHSIHCVQARISGALLALGYTTADPERRRIMQSLMVTRSRYTAALVNVALMLMGVNVIILVIQRSALMDQTLLQTNLMFYAILLVSQALSKGYMHQGSLTRVDFTFTALNLFLLWRCITIQSPVSWTMNASSRCTLRLGIGICILDHRQTAVWNLLGFLANVYKHVQIHKVLFAEMREPLTVYELAVPEFMTSIFAWFLAYVVECWLVERTAANLRTQRFETEKSAAHRLLSAFCDVIVHIQGPELRFAGPHKKLSQLLMAKELSGGIAEVEAERNWPEFAAYLVAADKPRFQNFVMRATNSNTQALDAEEATQSLTPSCLPVTMTNTAGRLLEVDLYIVDFPDAEGEIGHLLGICEHACGEPQESAYVAADIFTGSRPGARTSSLSSRSSRSSPRSGSQRGPRRLTELESIEIAFDPFSEDFLVESCALHFNSEAIQPERVPRLDAWIKHFPSFSDWVVGQVCQSCAGRDAQAELCDVALRSPYHSDYWLLVDTAVLHIVSSGDDSPDSSSSSSSENLDVSVRFSGFSVLSSAALHQRGRSLSAIKE